MRGSIHIRTLKSAILIAAMGLSAQSLGAPRLLMTNPQAPAASAVAARVAAAVEVAEALPGTSRVAVSSVRPAGQLSTWMLAPGDAGDGRLAVDAFGQTIVLTADKIEPRPGGGLAWFGRVESVGGAGTVGTAVLAVRDGKVGGLIELPGREIHLYPAAADRVVLRQVDASRASPDHRPDFENAPPVTGASGDAATITPIIGPTEISIHFSVSQSAKLKLLTLYPSIQKAVEDAVEKANLTFINSGIDIRFVSAGIWEITNYQEVDSWKADRDAFFAHAGAKIQRKAVKADIGVLLADSEPYCGEVQRIKANAATAVTIIEWSCAAGSYVLAHEVGHLFGAEHDPENASETPAFSYGHGYFVKYADDALSWRDVMSYANPCTDCPRVPYWSSPAKSYPPNTPGAQPMGSAAKFDNARVMRDAAAKVAAFGDQL